MPTSDSTALRLERRVLDSATLTSGVEQVIDFALPLFAGAILGLSPGQTGVLIAVDQVSGFLVRPIAGTVVDRADRLIVAGAGAGVLAAGCGLYALATGLPLALTAAVITGAAQAFLWVAIRAIIGERLPEDSSVFAKLVAAGGDRRLAGSGSRDHSAVRRRIPLGVRGHRRVLSPGRLGSAQ